MGKVTIKGPESRCIFYLPVWLTLPVKLGPAVWPIASKH